MQPQTWITGDIFTTSVTLATLKAWEPWDYTRHVLFELQNSDIDDDHPEWRLYWFAGVAMLRSIGHVLHKVDTLQSPHHSAAIKSKWADWNRDKDTHWVFFDFIEKERNNLLKEFSFGAELPREEDGRVLAYDNTEADAAQLFREAVYWWRTQLNEIEAEIVSRGYPLKTVAK